MQVDRWRTLIPANLVMRYASVFLNLKNKGHYFENYSYRWLAYAYAVYITKGRPDGTAAPRPVGDCQMHGKEWKRICTPLPLSTVRCVFHSLLALGFPSQIRLPLQNRGRGSTLS